MSTACSRYGCCSSAERFCCRTEDGVDDVEHDEHANKNFKLGGMKNVAKNRIVHFLNDYRSRIRMGRRIASRRCCRNTVGEFWGRGTARRSESMSVGAFQVCKMSTGALKDGSFVRSFVQSSVCLHVPPTERRGARRRQRKLRRT